MPDSAIQKKQGRFSTFVAEGDRLYFDKRDFSSALASYHAAQDLDEKDAGLWRKVGLCRVKLNQLPRAVAALETAHRLAPKDATILNTLAVVLLKAKKPEAALLRALGAVKLKPDDPNVWDTVAEVQVAMRDVRGARASYRKVLSLDPGNARARAALERLEKARSDTRRGAKEPGARGGTSREE